MWAEQVLLTVGAQQREAETVPRDFFAIQHAAPFLAHPDPHRGSMPSACVTSNAASPPPPPQILNKLPRLPLSIGKYYDPSQKKTRRGKCGLE